MPVPSCLPPGEDFIAVIAGTPDLPADGIQEDRYV